MAELLRILTYARPVGRILPAYVLLVILAAFFSVVNLSVIIPLLQVLFDRADAPGAADFHGFFARGKTWFYSWAHHVIREEGKLWALYHICGLAAFSMVLANVFRYLSQLLLAKVRVRVTKNLRLATFESIMGLNVGHFIHHPKGDLIGRVTADIQEVEQSAVNTLKIFFKEPLLMMGYLVALVAISPTLTLYALLLVPVAGALVSLVAKRVKDWARKSQESIGRIGNVVNELIDGIRVIKVFNAQDWMRDKFSSRVGLFAGQTFQVAMRANLSSPISEIIGTVALVVLLVIGGGMVLSEPPGLSGATFIGFLAIFSQTLNPAKSMSVAAGQVNKGLAAAQRVFELMDQNKGDDQKGREAVPLRWNAIRLENVNFSYGRDCAIRSLSLTIKKGQHVALVGPSGGGKSTVADLLCCFYQPQSGRIVIGEKDLAHLDRPGWLREIAVVSQEAVLFNDTIRNNILIGCPEASGADLIAAAQMANAHDFIKKLPNGFDTVIGEKGDMLSGGQKQRITIARAFLKNPSLLILDEPAHGLDAKSEMAVNVALNKLSKDRTTLHIAHQLSSISRSDRIFVIDDGKVVEQGTHTELLRKNGLYQYLLGLQTI